MPTTEELSTRLRNETDLSKISGTLAAVASSRFDVVAPQSALRVERDIATITDPNGEPQLTEAGVTSPVIEASMTRMAERQIAGRLKLPLQYHDRLRGGEAITNDLADHSINTLAAIDDRKALYRFLRADDGLMLRSVLSDSYGLFDNDRALHALIEGLGASGLGLGDCQVKGDVTPDRLRLRITVPAIELAVPDLLGDYRMPFSMKPENGMHARPDAGETPPVLWAGIEIGNSETGNGTFFVRPRAEVAICRNGLVKPIEFKRAHLGARLSDGEINWSGETRQNVYKLVASQVADVVRTYLSTDYLATVAAEMRAAKGVAIESAASAIEVVTDQIGLNDDEQRNVFDCFARGGDSTLLGLGQAVTAAAQLVEDGDRQAELEGEFWNVLNSPARYATV